MTKTQNKKGKSQTEKKVTPKKTVTKSSVKKIEPKTKTVKKTNSTPKKSVKKKKGFTLVELISVVVLLAIVTTIAGLSISSIGQSVRTRQKTNMLNSMQVQAKKYVNDTGIKKVYVDTLIKEGYVTADSDKTNSATITDPSDTNATLNCYYYDFTNDQDGELKDPQVDADGNCSTEILSDVMIKIQYSENGGSTYKDFDGSWIKKDSIRLKAVSNNTSVISNTDISANSTWTTPLAPDVYHSPSGTFDISSSDGYLNATYQVTVVKDGTTYTASQLIKIDTKSPVVTNVRIDNPSTMSTEKHIYADFEDTGSGLAAYAISTKTSASSLIASDWKNLTNKKIVEVNTNSDDNKVTSNGNYYVYAKDAAGNVGRSAQFEVKNLDGTPPTCTLSGTSTTWTSANRTIVWGCQDDETGCDPSYSGGSTTYNTTTKTATINAYTIKDMAGNSTTCPSQTVNVYVDKTAPTVSSFTIKSYNSNYNARDVKYTISGTDSHSGIDKYCFSDSSSSASCDWKTANSANYTFTANNGSGTSYTRYAFVKDKAGNVSSYSSKSYTLYKYCNETKGLSNWSSCNATCGTGSKYQSLVDKYFNEYFCKYDYQSCTVSSGCCDITISSGCYPEYDGCYERTVCNLYSASNSSVFCGAATSNWIDNCSVVVTPDEPEEPSCKVNSWRCNDDNYGRWEGKGNGCDWHDLGAYCTEMGSWFCYNDKKDVYIWYCDPDDWCYDEYGNEYRGDRLSYGYCDDGYDDYDPYEPYDPDPYYPDPDPYYPDPDPDPYDPSPSVTTTDIYGYRCVWKNKDQGKHNGTVIYMTYCEGTKPYRTCYDSYYNSYDEGYGQNDYSFAAESNQECQEDTSSDDPCISIKCVESGSDRVHLWSGPGGDDSGYSNAVIHGMDLNNGYVCFERSGGVTNGYAKLSLNNSNRYYISESWNNWQNNQSYAYIWEACIVGVPGTCRDRIGYTC